MLYKQKLNFAKVLLMALLLSLSFMTSGASSRVASRMGVIQNVANEEPKKSKKQLRKELRHTFGTMLKGYFIEKGNRKRGRWVWWLLFLAILAGCILFWNPFGQIVLIVFLIALCIVGGSARSY